MTRHRILLPTALLAAALVLAGCTATGTPVRTREPGAAVSSASGFDPTAGVPAELRSFYAQEAAWADCGEETQCADVTVPLDYEHPAGETIQIAVRRLNSGGPDAPALFLNPGGPGGSGTAMLDWFPQSLSERMAAAWNPVGFDPRGVNRSTAVDCLTDAELDDWLARTFDTSSAAGVDEYAQAMADFGKRCADGTGPLLDHVDTDSAARDLDILRAVVGRSDTLDYMGFSYGTFLGAVYADLFTQRVGRFTLDGAVDPSLDIAQLGLGQAAGFEAAAREYVADCLAGSDCPLSGTVEMGLADIRTVLEVTRATPLPTGDAARPLTYSLALTGVLLALYDDSLWPYLSAGLDNAMVGDGSGLLLLADFGNGRLEDGTYEDNSNEAFLAINCLDYPVEGSRADWARTASEISQVSPTFGDALAWTEVACDAWPYKAQRERGLIAAPGSAPILVVGTTRDPATPYEWAVNLADQLEEGHLLTYDGSGHTAYGRSNQCVLDAVDSFMLEGTVPAQGATC